ncbi:hypothetical protein MMC34_002078 [Xylographa carneopallida]|nr:hypothetical protein [Xylographa carneopallida]
MSHDQLPPLVEAVPEIRNSYAVPERQIQYSRMPYSSSHGPSHFPEARSLAPSPIVGGRSRVQQPVHSQASHGNQISRIERPHYTDQASHSVSSSSYSEQNRARGFHNGRTEPLPSMGSRSPVLLPAPRLHSSHGSNGSYEPGSLPTIYANGRPGASYQNNYQDSYFQACRNSSPPRQASHPAYNTAYRHDYNYASSQYSDRSPFSNGGSGSYPLSYDGSSEQGDGKQKRRRGNLPKTVTDTLRVWFTEHIAHPYPTEEEKQILMSQTGLTISQISNWFINARRRSLPQMTKQAQTEAEIRDSQSGSHPSSKMRT